MDLEVTKLGPTTITLRPQLARREFTLDGFRCLYLSLFEREVDQRVGSFVQRIREARIRANDIRNLGYYLEPTDAVLMSGQDSLVIWKGGACAIPLYWQPANQETVITTRLPHPSTSGLSRHGLIASFALVAAVLQNDQNLVLQSSVAGWRRIRRGAATYWRGRGESAKFSEVLIDFAEAPLSEHLLRYDGIVEDLRSQMERFRKTQLNAGPVVFELSGGMDSTLAAWSVRRSGERPLGISISFPFYEFRFEEEIQIETAKALGAERIVVDGRDLYAYATQDPRLSLDEPAMLSMIAKREETFARIAHDAGVSTILVGEGGDQLLSEHLLQPMEISDQIDRRAMTTGGRKALDATVREMRAAPAGCLNRSTLCFSYDSRLAPVIKERWGVTARTPFTDLGMVLCGVAYAKWCARHGFNPGKRILVDAFADILPGAILERRGKVAWDGVYARTYIANESALNTEFESCHDTLEEIGFDVQWLQRRTRALGKLEATEYSRDDREIMGAYAIAYWLNEKGIYKRSDCAWCDGTGE